MDEYIRREDAIKCIEGQCVDGKMWGNDESEGTLIEAYSAIDDLMEIPPADVAPVRHERWIPVTERLPDEHESLFARYKGTDKWINAMFMTISDLVIVCAEYENGEPIVKTANTVDGVWKVKGIFHPCKVTHWMPMPKPPKRDMHNE